MTLTKSNQRDHEHGFLEKKRKTRVSETNGNAISNVITRMLRSKDKNHSQLFGSFARISLGFWVLFMTFRLP